MRNSKKLIMTCELYPFRCFRNFSILRFIGCPFSLAAVGDATFKYSTVARINKLLIFHATRSQLEAYLARIAPKSAEGASNFT